MRRCVGLFLVCIGLAWDHARLGAQGTSQPPFDPNVLGTIIQLQQAQLEIVNNLIQIHESLLQDVLAKKPIPSSDPRGSAMQMLGQKVTMLREQQQRLGERMPPAGAVPPDLAQALAATQQNLQDEMMALGQKATALQAAWPRGSAPPAPPPDPGAPPPPHTLPSTPSEAGAAVNRGDVKSVRSLIETFTQIPEQKIPRGNLDHYRSDP